MPCPNHDLLHFDFHAFPERDIAFNILCRVFGCRIVPSRILVHLSIHFNAVVASNALPRAGGMGIAVLKVLLVDGVWGEVLVVFHHYALVALGENRTIPDCFGHCYFT